MGDRQLNRQAAEIFRECAGILQHQAANPFRVSAYVRAANVLDALQDDVRELLDREGADGLVKLPGIGEGLAAAIDEIARTGRLSQLDRLRGEASPEALFQTLPGVGRKLAEDIHETLHVDSLEALENAAHDGSLLTVPGIGERRAAAIRAGLAAMLGRGRPRRRRHGRLPAVQLLLEIDAEYRKKAAAGELPKIAPKRFNPEGRAWLPILHAEREGWHFTALFSNTARAHELGRTDDWVVIYFYDDDHQEGQCTVVTETRGPREGKRVVRGRENE
ncbi:MAG TPA: helix-hairpin-helix domain-containing protein [Woeseiaceae bacterium]|nr:helix-hairpin-helix domain-containing protein [Woeseiaceae bacterium]